MVKTPPASAGDAGDSGLIPGSGRFPGEGRDNPLQHVFFIILCIWLHRILVAAQGI